MASKSLKRFRGRLILYIFFVWGEKSVIAGDFTKLDAQNVVFECLIVVDLW
jgi:hypothetical protein